jgi:hypothetical protein
MHMRIADTGIGIADTDLSLVSIRARGADGER